MQSAAAWILFIANMDKIVAVFRIADGLPYIGCHHAVNAGNVAVDDFGRLDPGLGHQRHQNIETVERQADEGARFELRDGRGDRAIRDGWP